MTIYTYLSSYNNYGKPDNLNVDKDDSSDIKESISQDLLDEINTNLPEGNTIVNIHSDWIKKSDLFINELCEMSVTFIHEGAGYKNVLAYYVYDKTNPPTKFSDVGEVIIILPNTSLSGSGGELNPGDTIQIPYTIDTVTTSNGRRFMETATWSFPAGKAVAWVCMANRWKQNGSSSAYVATGHQMYSSDPILNPENTFSLRNHCVNFQSQTDNTKIINGFEDIHREKGWCDHDFNDLVFYTTVTPFEAVDRSSYNSTVNQTFKGTILTEDLWNKDEDSKGNNSHDNDYNDLTMYYDITETLNGTKIKNISFTLEVVSRGASYDHDFGVIIPNIKDTNAKIYRETYTASTDTTTLDNITSDIIGNISDRVPIIQDTKTFFPDTSIWATNTVSGTDIMEPSWSKVRIIFPGDGIEKSELDNIQFPYNFYLRAWFMVGEVQKTRHYLYSDTDYKDVSSTLSAEGITEQKKILILENVNNFRVPIEKQPLRYVYHKYLENLKGNTTYLAWHLEKYCRQHLVYPLVDVSDTHNWNSIMDYSKDPSTSNYCVVPMDMDSEVYTWTSSSIETILSNHNYNLSDLLDWDEIDTSDKIEKVIDFINKYGTLHIIKDGDFSYTSGRNYYISLTSIQTNPGRLIHETLSGQSDTIELLSWTSLYTRCLVSV